MAPWARRLGCVLALDKCVQMWTRNYGALGPDGMVCFGVLCANKKKEEVKRDFGDLRIRRSKGRVVNTPLGFKRVLFEEEKKGEETRKERSGRKGQESQGERTDGRRRREGRRKETKRVGERESEARLEWRRGLSPEIGEKKDDERRWR
ncbi:hypothetical protein TNCV_1780921 [Trichonephila clavipes]|nr:hypothetical protein TNCV_1780921 [Trichonephila clavipes]